MPNASREDLISAFLIEAGWGGARRTPLAGDASNRRYLRIDDDGRQAVLMDSPPERGEDVRPFQKITAWLRESGLSAPEIYAADPESGFLLLEDLGDDLYARLIADRSTLELPLYEAAVDLLLRLGELPSPPLAPYDGVVLDREAELFVDWWLPGTGQDVTGDLTRELRDLVAQATKAVSAAREVVVLRDYHAENLLWLPHRKGLARVGLLDYQDALHGHAAYDLVSLLEDARRHTSPELQDAMLSRYLTARPGLDGQEFRQSYAVLGAQRNLKIVGIFARLARRDGKPRYLSLIPRVWGHLQRDLSHPALADLRDWVTRYSPAPEPAVLERVGRVEAV